MVNVIIFIIGLVAFVVGIVHEVIRAYMHLSDRLVYEDKFRDAEEMPPFKKFKINVAYVSIALAGVAVMVFSLSFTIIPTGYTGVRTIFGQIDEETASNGFNFHLPFVESIEKVNNKQQDITFDGQIWSETENRTAIYYDAVTVTYQISKDKSAWIYANISNYKDNLVTQSLVASAIKASSKSLKDEDATNRGKIEPASMKNIQASLDEKYGENTVIVNKVVIGNADFDEDYNQAISEKQKAQLAYEQQQIENKKLVEQEQAKADAKVLAAQAEADANKILADSLSDDIFTQMILDKWNGELPKVVGENNAMFDVSSFLNEKQ